MFFDIAEKMTFDSLIYNILLLLYVGLLYDKPIPSEMESVEQIEEWTGVKIPQRYWDAAIKAIAERRYAEGFECDLKTGRFYIGDASKLVLTYGGYEFMKQERFPDPNEAIAEIDSRYEERK